MLALLYATPHQHDKWGDHVLRVKATIELGRELIALTGSPQIIADLSCGDAVIAKVLAQGIVGSIAPAEQVILGDVAPGYLYHGPIEQTLLAVDHADLFICCETLEHLDDPDAVLAALRYRADALLLSTPLDDPAGLMNPEHYWTWDDADVRDMLIGAGWDPRVYQLMPWCDDAGTVWRYQIWGCT